MAQTNVQAFSGDVEISSNLAVDTNTLFVDTVGSKVGVGTTEPGATLEVTGNAYVSSNLEVGTANLFVDTTTGRVGIGKTDPGAALDITGPMRLGDELSNVVDLSVVVGDPILGALSHQAELAHPTPTSGDQFGYSVSISADGNYALVGSPYDDPVASSAGSAQVYVRDGTSWTHQAELVHPTPASSDLFGWSVSISADGNYALVGAYKDDPVASDAGSAQVYVRDGTSWTHQAELVHPTPASSDRFGYSVSISGDGNYALVGAYFDDTGGNGAGSAQVYVRDGTSWTHQAELAHPTPAGTDYFGQSVSISGDGNYALVGSPYDDPVASAAGSAQVYVRNGTSWTHQAELVHPTPASNDQFGWSVSISADGNYALVGSPFDDPVASTAGSAQVYVRNGTSWTHQAELLHPTPAGGDQFGVSVSISGDGNYVLVGAFFDDPVASAAGSVQVYVRNGTSWTHKTEVLHPTPSGNARFGISVSISADGNYVLGGAYFTAGVGSADVYFSPIIGFNKELTVSVGIRADGTLLSFTGQHICFPEGRMSQGLVVSANQNKYMSLNGPVTMGLGAIKSSESLPVVSLSNVVNDRSVFGVVDRFEGGGVERTQTIGIGRVSSSKEFGDNRVIVNSIGEGALWVANTNGNLVSGDYLTTSSLPGYAQKQDSDSLRNSTVAKITMDCDFSPEDLPVQIIKKKENGDNDLDPYGRFQWVDSEETQKAYKVRYLDVSGSQTDQSNAAHIAAYVGCTYHCG